jgi:hypothetical protein
LYLNGGRHLLKEKEKLALAQREKPKALSPTYHLKIYTALYCAKSSGES